MIKGTKYDLGKNMLRLLPYVALEEVGKVLTYGASKYAPENWRHVEDLEARYTDAALRHLFAHLRGEIYDEESNLRHLAHAAANLLFVLEGVPECPPMSSPATHATLNKTPTNYGSLKDLPTDPGIPYYVPFVPNNFGEYTVC